MSKRGSGEGSIYQRKDGRWVAAITVQGHKRRYFYGRTRKEVAEKLNEAMGLKSKGRLGMPTKQTVQTYIEEWLSNVAAIRVRKQTVRNYRIHLGHVCRYVGKVRLEALTNRHLQAVVSELTEEYEASYVHSIMTTLHNALMWAVDQGRIPFNPAERLTLPKVERRKRVILTKEQARLLLEGARGTRWHALWAVLLSLGLRRSEALGLRWSDLDEERGWLQVDQQYIWVEGDGMRAQELKTRRSHRTVPVAPFVLQSLKSHRSIQAQERLLAGPDWQDHGLIFPSQKGKPHYPAYIIGVLHADLERLGLPRMRLHDMRHTAATLMLENGVSPKVVQEILGHESFATTMDTYAQVSTSAKETASDAMQRVLSTA